MGFSVLELVLQCLREKGFHADVAYPGQKFPQISDVVAAVHLQRVDADTVKLRCTPAVKIAFLSDIPWSAGRMVRGEGVTEAEYTIKHNLCERFVRVEVTDANGLTAWSNIIEV